jgi:hypothetical protein
MVPDTENTCVKKLWAAVKKAVPPGARLGSGPPAPGGPPRTPGSCTACASADPDTMAAATNVPKPPVKNQAQTDRTCDIPLTPLLNSPLLTHIKSGAVSRCKETDHPLWKPLQLLGQTEKEAAARAVLRSKFANAIAGSKFINLVKQVDHVETHGQRLIVG